MKVPGTILSVSSSAYLSIGQVSITTVLTNYHSKLGRRLKVIALIDPATERAKEVLKKKCDSFVLSAYENTRVFKNFDDYLKNMPKGIRPRAFIVGSPPMFRGTLQSGRDIETQIIKHFPGVALFIEKPIATGPAEEIEEGFKIAKQIEDTKTICSVGYDRLARRE